MTKARLGTKILPEDAKALEPAKRVLATSLAPDVEGQELKVMITECPWCGELGRSVIDTDRTNWYECSCCGRPFRA